MIDTDGGWKQWAACGPDDGDAFFLDGRRYGRLSDANRAALRMCGGCPVRRECGEHAASHPEPFTRIAGGRVWRRDLTMAGADRS